MSVKAILVGASGGSATNGTIELACRLANMFGAYLEGLHVRIDIRELEMAVGAEDLSAAVRMQWVDELAANAASQARKVEDTFREAAARNTLPFAETAVPGKPRACWREETGDASSILSARARFFDLVVLGRSERVIDKPFTSVIEQTLIYSGRPVLLAPADPPLVCGNTIAVAWNGSPQAVRAIAAALPFLQAAKATLVITIGDLLKESADSMCDYLHVHGIAASVRGLSDRDTAGFGRRLLTVAKEEGADTLVMGGYGHAPWREALFGGTTRNAIDVSTLPLLIAH